MPNSALCITVCTHTHLAAHRRSLGVHWVHVQPQGGEKNLGPNLQGKVVSAPQRTRAPPGIARVDFLMKFGRTGRCSGYG